MKPTSQYRNALYNEYLSAQDAVESGRDIPADHIEDFIEELGNIAERASEESE